MGIKKYYPGKIITPGTSPQLISQGFVVQGDQNLIPSNILSGLSIFGVAGSVVAGIKFASGTVTSSSSASTFTQNTGTTVNLCSVTVTGLTFTPSKILLVNAAASGGSYQDVCVYDASEALVSGGYKIIQCSLGNNSIYGIKETVAPVSVTSNGFTLPVAAASGSYKWYAYGN